MGRLALVLGAVLLALAFAMIALPGRDLERGADPSDPGWSDGGDPTLRDPARVPERGEGADEASPDGDAPAPEVRVDRGADVDLAARAELTLVVRDEHGGPVADAEVAARGFWKEGVDSLFLGRDDVAAATTTDHEGRATLAHLVWAGRDEPLAALDLSVRHPEFAPWRDRRFAVGDGEREVTLAFGANVVVEGWIGSPSNRVLDLEVRCEDEADLPADAWQRDRKGRLACTWLAPGPHCVVATHVDEGGVRWASAGHRFEVLPNGFHVLKLELFRPERLTGVLAQDVPRPVTNGTAQLLVSAAEPGSSEPTIVTAFQAPVAEDGTFAFDDLPRGHGALFVLTDGWASVPASHEEWPVGASVPIPQELDPHVVAMEPAASLVVTVIDPFGVPLPDADVVASPGFLNQGAGGANLGGRPWRLTTDAEGRAHFPSVPATDHLPLRVFHAAYELPPAGRDGGPAVRVRAGQRAATKLELVAKDR